MVSRSTYRFPSEEFPALPSLALEVPSTWEPVPTPMAVISVAAPAEEGRFRTNVVVTISRHGDGFDLDSAEAELISRTTLLPEASDVGTARRRQGNDEAVIHEVAFLPPDAGTVIQSHLLLLVEHARGVDLIHGIGSCAADRIETDLVDLRSVLGSLVARRD